MHKSPVGVFEIIGVDSTDYTTYILQDCCAWSLPSNTISSSADHKAYQKLDKIFEVGCNPTDVAVFDNVAYVAMGADFRRIGIDHVIDNGSGKPRFFTNLGHNLIVGDLIRISNCTQSLYNGIWKVTATSINTSFEVSALTYTALSPNVPVTGTVYKINNRYIRRFKDNIWSKDDNTYKDIASIANNGSGKARFAVTGHGYSVGDYVYLVNMTVASYNSMSTLEVSTLYQITAVSDVDPFDINAISFNGTATGLVNRQDSDVQAQNLAVVGDLLVRSYEDAVSGWVTSRVDAVSSNIMLDANWTAGIGKVSVGDINSPITDIIPVGGGEVITTASCAFVYNKSEQAYINEIPELEAHRHPNNGKGSVEWKGWVYIPTVIGVFRWRNGQVQNVTPGRFGQQAFETPVGPIGWLTGDTERLYAVTTPFKVSQLKQVVGGQTSIYVDYNNIGTALGTPDYSLDPTYDLDTLTAAGYIYLGSTQPWHRMFIEMDAYYNTLNGSNSNLWIDTAEYWNGSAWTARSELSDFTRTRDTSTKEASSFAQSGDLVFKSPMPTDWAVGGTAPAGALSTSYYWCRFSLNAGISNSSIIKRVIAGVHVSSKVFNAFPSNLDFGIDAGLVQFVLSMKEEAGKGIIWQTMYSWMQHETTSTRTTGGASFNTGGAQPVGCISIIQPNRLRAGPTGTRFLFVGGHNNNYICPLGHTTDPTEDGPYMQGYAGQDRRAILILPDTDLGLPNITKSLREIDFKLEGITLNDTYVQVYYRTDFGNWTSAGSMPSVMPIKLPTGSEPSGLTFGLAIVLKLDTAKYIRLPRIDRLPLLRAF